MYLLPPCMRIRGRLARALQPSLRVRRVKGGLGLLPLLTPPLPVVWLKRHGRRHPIAQVLITPGLYVLPWGSCCPLGWPTSFELELIGGGGVGGYCGGVGVGVVRVCGPKVVSLSLLPVRYFDQTLLPPGCVPEEVGSWCPPPPFVMIFSGISPYGRCCAWAAVQISPGVPPYGGICALV